MLITGGGRGPGRNTALSIARRGGDVVITCRERADDARDVVAQITALGGKAAVDDIGPPGAVGRTPPSPRSRGEGDADQVTTTTWLGSSDSQTLLPTSCTCAGAALTRSSTSLSGGRTT